MIVVEMFHHFLHSELPDWHAVQLTQAAIIKSKHPTLRSGLLSSSRAKKRLTRCGMGSSEASGVGML